MDLFAELTQLVDAFDAEGVDYAVCGALALAVHGHPRATKDIDVMVPFALLDHARAAAKARGFTIEALPMTFSSSGITVHRFTKLDGSRALMLDVLVADGVLANVWSTRCALPFAGGQLWVVSREGLITLKLAAAQPQDLADVARLLENEVATPTGDQVEARLRRCAALSRDGVARRGVDYSRAAVEQRLRELAEVSELCRRLVEIGAAARAPLGAPTK